MFTCVKMFPPDPELLAYQCFTRIRALNRVDPPQNIAISSEQKTYGGSLLQYSLEQNNFSLISFILETGAKKVHTVDCWSDFCLSFTPLDTACILRDDAVGYSDSEIR